MAETIIMPKLGFDMAEGTLVRWMKKAGEAVTKGEVLAEIETDKATVEVESTAAGVVLKLLVDEGAVVPVSTPIAMVGSPDEKIEPAPATAASQPPKVESGPAVVPAAPQAAPVAETTLPPAAGSVTPSTMTKVSPLARKIAREQKVDLGRIQGTGPGGRIVRRDIEQALTAGPSGPAVQISRADEIVQSTKLRQAIARRMTESKASVPHFYVSHEYKMEALLELRRQFNEIIPEEEKISVNDFIVKAVALNLRQFPNLNSSLSGTSVVRHGAVNIGVAVSVEGGLLTVVCREADRKPLRQIAAEVKAMVGRARQGKVRPDDIEGGTFTISNLGMFDVENFIAIINPPEAAILALGSAREVPVVENGAIQPGWRMKATLSVDHRLSDGVEAARFLQALAVFVEEPLRLLVEP